MLFFSWYSLQDPGKTEAEKHAGAVDSLTEYYAYFYSCDFDYRPCLGVLDTTCSVTPTTKIGYNDITDYIVESERR
jgi:hypothetical protein